MKRVVITGRANPPLAQAVCERLGARLGNCNVETLPDSEVRVELIDSVSGCDVYILQPTGPGERHLIELLLLADACRRSRAARVTAVVTYFGYARQDRRARGREAVAARVMSDILATAGLARLVAVDLHDPSLEGFFDLPIEHLSAVATLARAVKPLLHERTVVVAPDLGATKLAERYARLLDAPVAIVHKTRLSGEEVSVRHVVGDVAERAPLIVDDMITTGGTIEAAVRALVEHGSLPKFTVVATHAILVHRAVDRLARFPLRAMCVTDTLAVPPADTLPLKIVSVAPLLADAIERLHWDRPLDDLIVHE